MIISGLVLAGAVGAVLRYLVDRAVQSRLETDFPFGTLVINVGGSLLLGFLTGSALHHGLPSAPLTVVGTGMIGAFTTFSTFTYDTFRLLGSDSPVSALVNVGVSLVAGLAAALAGLALGSLT